MKFTFYREDTNFDVIKKSVYSSENLRALQDCYAELLVIRPIDKRSFSYEIAGFVRMCNFMKKVMDGKRIRYKLGFWEKFMQHFFR